VRGIHAAPVKTRATRARRIVVVAFVVDIAHWHLTVGQQPRDSMRRLWPFAEADLSVARLH
jgi:hypothetical protein